MAYCCVPLCTSNSKTSQGISFHEIPSNPEHREKWLKVIPRDDWSPNTTSNYSRVCSKHFVSSDYTQHIKIKRLKPGTVPSVFSLHDVQKQQTAKMPNCCVPFCRSRQESDCQRTFHKFPFKKPDVLTKWLSNIKRGNWYPSKKSVICSKHFRESAITKTDTRVRLKEGAVPTEFSFPCHLHVKEENGAETTPTEQVARNTGPILGESTCSDHRYCLLPRTTNRKYKNALHDSNRTRKKLRLLPEQDASPTENLENFPDKHIARTSPSVRTETTIVVPDTPASTNGTTLKPHSMNIPPVTFPVVVPDSSVTTTTSPGTLIPSENNLKCISANQTFEPIVRIISITGEPHDRTSSDSSPPQKQVQSMDEENEPSNGSTSPTDAKLSNAFLSIKQRGQTAGKNSACKTNSFPTSKQESDVSASISQRTYEVEVLVQNYSPKKRSSPHTGPLQNIPEREKLMQTLKSHQKMIGILRGKVKKLEKENKNMKESSMNYGFKTNRVENIIKCAREFLPKNTLKLFASQLRLSLRGRKKGVRWNNVDKKFALSLYFHYRDAFELCSKFLSFPGKDRLQKWIKSVPRKTYGLDDFDDAFPSDESSDEMADSDMDVVTEMSDKVT